MATLWGRARSSIRLTALFYGEVSEHPEPEPRKNVKAATGRT